MGSRMCIMWRYDPFSGVMLKQINYLAKNIIETSVYILVFLFHVIAVLDDTSVTETPEIYIAVEKFTKKGPIRDYLYDNQIQQEAEVKDGVIYERRHPAHGGKSEEGIAEILQETFKLYDTRFSEGVSAYWTVAIRIARRNSGSKWHSYAWGLPVGVQTIKVKTPKHWFSERVRSWLDVKEKKVLVY